MWKLMVVSAILGAVALFTECRKKPALETPTAVGKVVMPAPVSFTPHRVIYADPEPMPPPIPYVARPVAQEETGLPPSDVPPERPPENTRGTGRPTR